MGFLSLSFPSLIYTKVTSREITVWSGSPILHPLIQGYCLYAYFLQVADNMQPTRKTHHSSHTADARLMSGTWNFPRISCFCCRRMTPKSHVNAKGVPECSSTKEFDLVHSLSRRNYQVQNSLVEVSIPPLPKCCFKPGRNGRILSTIPSILVQFMCGA